jgi:two-component system cell cycle response regulator DivK
MEGKKVLIAEDSSVIQNLTKRILQLQNYAIFSAKNGLEVLSMLESDPYDIILMDINMPKMDGMECAKNIRALADSKNPKFPSSPSQAMPKTTLLTTLRRLASMNIFKNH